MYFMVPFTSKLVDQFYELHCLCMPSSVVNLSIIHYLKNDKNRVMILQFYNLSDSVLSADVTVV